MREIMPQIFLKGTIFFSPQKKSSKTFERNPWAQKEFFLFKPSKNQKDSSIPHFFFLNFSLSSFEIFFIIERDLFR